MSQYQVTLDPQVLQRLFSGESQLGQLLEAVLNQILEAQVTEQLQAAPYERTEERQGYPFVLVDALVLKVREGGRVRAVSALVAVGVNEQGYREILGLQLGDSESERSWMAFFTWLKGRGLTGVALVVGDHQGGLVNAVRIQFQGATWQRCQTHLSANVADATPKALQAEVHMRLRAIFDAPDLETARTLLARFTADFVSRPLQLPWLPSNGASTTRRRCWRCHCTIAAGYAPPTAWSGSTRRFADANTSFASSPTGSP